MSFQVLAAWLKWSDDNDAAAEVNEYIAFMRAAAKTGFILRQAK